LKKIFTYIFTALLCVSMAGCSSAGGISTFTAPVEKMPANFDPQIASASEDLLVINNIFDGLFELQNGEVVKNMAEDCNISADGKTYTITIKDGNIFNCRGKHKEAYNGTAVTAHDYAFALNRVLDPKTHSPYSEDFSNILSVTAEKPNVLCIKLKTADFNFSEKLAMPAAYPCNEEFFYRTGGAYGLTVDNILSNGPFMLNYLDSEGGNATIIRMAEADNAVERIRIKQTDSSAQAEEYRNEAISGYFSFSSQKTELTGTSSLSFDSGNISLVFNKNKPVFDNEKIRQSLGWYAFGFKNSGANMDAVSSTGSVFPGTITLAGDYINNIITPAIPAYMAASPKELLRQGLAEMGISRIDATTILMPDDSIYTLIYENINQLWQKNLGQFFTIEYLPTAQIKQRVDSGDFDIAFLPLTPSNRTPYGVLDKFTAYSSTLEETVNSAKAMSDQKNAVSLIAAAQKTLLERAIVVPMGSEHTVFYFRNYFHNIYIDPFTGCINLKYATVK